MAKKSDSGQSTPKYTTAEEQAEKRHAAQARKRRHRSSGVSTEIVPLFDAIKQDAQARREAEKEVLVARREAAKRQFRQNQADRAKHLLKVPANSLTETAALKLIEAFVFAEANPAYNLTLTGAAENTMKANLTSEQRANWTQVQAGVSAARTALKKAYEQLNTRSAHQATTPQLVNA